MEESSEKKKKSKAKPKPKPVYFYPLIGGIVILLIAVSVVIYIQFQNEKKVSGKTEPVKILMLGNDLLVNNDIPDMVRQIFARANVKRGVAIESIALPDRNYFLSEHLKSKSLKKILDRNENWDFIVLQESPHQILDHPYEVLKDIRAFRKKFKKGSPRIVLVTPWVNESEKVKQDVLSAIVRKMAKNLSVVVVPVGDLFFDIKAKYPEVKVYMDDKHQANANGAWIASASIYSVIHGRRPLISEKGPGYKIGEQEKPHASLSLQEKQSLADMIWAAASLSNRGFTLGLQKQTMNNQGLTPRLQ